jgi:DNA ligase-1
MLKIIVLIFLTFINLNALDLQKPKIYQGDENISLWYMSEKLDGIRGYWDGKNLYTKNGKRLYPPKYFIKDMPSFPIDGELWTFRDDFENIQSIVMDKTPSKNWKQITYNIFEVPDTKGNFTTRVQKLKNYLKTNPSKIIKIIPQIVCKNKNHLNKYLNSIVKNKGEGLIIKDPNTNYHTGRSFHILKVKKYYDMEAVVIGINYRKNSTIMKSLKVQLKNKVIFNLGGGFSNKQRLNYPKKDDIVTFKYYGFTKLGKPKFASFLHIRKY